MPKLPILLVPALLLAAAEVPKFAVWSASDLKGRANALSQKLDSTKLASEMLADYGNYNLQLAHREGTGGAELHQKFADVFVIQAGEGTVVSGGTIEGSHQTAPGEIRGTAVRGGEHRRVMTGDVVHIPAGMPHQMLVDAGHQVTYFVVKVESR